MKRLQKAQRDFLAGTFEKMYVVMFAVLVIGQFVPGKAVNWWAFGAGLAVILGMMAYAVRLKRENI